MNEKTESGAFAVAKPTRILVIRPDRLGDVLLSLGVCRALKDHWRRTHGQDCHVTFMVKQDLADFLRNFSALGIDDFLAVPESFLQKAPPWTKLREIKKFAQTLKAKRFNIALMLQVNSSLALAARFAGIPRRVGPFSKLASFLSFNEGVRQSRSEVKMHEADYNLKCLLPLGISVDRHQYPPALGTSTPRAGTKGKIVIHAGMGGSALNWPEKNYASLVALLLEKNEVVLTAGPTESELAKRVFSQATLLLHQKGEGNAAARLSIAETPTLWALAEVLGNAKLVVAPSTGPLHLAAALGTQVLGIYPPVKVQSAKRWGPLHATSGVLQEVVEPSLERPCPGKLDCIGERCEQFFCMERITAQQVFERILKLSFPIL